jgi:hypothetical protein
MTPKSISVAEVESVITTSMAVSTKPANAFAELVVTITERLADAKTFRSAAPLWLFVIASVVDCVGWLEFRSPVLVAVTASEELILIAPTAFEGRSAVMISGTSAN